jgi:hypothetical protein
VPEEPKEDPIEPELQEILTELEAGKSEATGLYQKGNYDLAYEQYSNIIDELHCLTDANPAGKRAVDDMKGTIYNNMALCQM